MRFNDPDGTFPRFRNYIVFDFGAMVKNDNLINPLARWAKIPADQARAYVAPGSGPELLLVDAAAQQLIGPLGDFPHSISIPRALVDPFETTSGKGAEAVYATGNGKHVYRAAVAILSALIRGSLLMFSKDDADRGSAAIAARQLAFEDEVYGGVHFSS
jgi:hypothetical protein